MAGSKETKEILKKPDEFITLSAKVLQWAKDHSKALAYVGLALAAAAVVFLVVTTYLGYADRKGQDAYNRAYNLLSDKGEAQDTKASALEAVNIFQEVIKDHGISDASRLALAQLADLKFREGNYGEAVSLYRAFIDKMRGDTRYVNLAKLAIASCLEANGDLDGALSLLEAIKDYPLLKEAALWGMARLYRLMNQTDKEKEVLRQFTESYPNSPFAAFGKARL